MNLKDYIKEQRPSLSSSSIETYNSILKNLYKKVFGDEEINIDNFNKPKKIMDYLKNIPINKRKTVLSALFVITENKAYREHMIDDIQKYNTEINKQEKTLTQKENWVETDEIKKIFDTLYNDFKLIIKKKKFTPEDYHDIQKFIILALYCGLFIPPRRSKDYCEFKLLNYDKENDNYMKGNKFYFNSYKTSKTYGQQEIDIPPFLKNIILKWKSINPTDYLLFDNNSNKLTNVKLNQRLNSIFDGKKIGVNALRHEYLTNKYKDVSYKLDEIDNDFKKMGSSKIQFKTYVKND